MNQLLNELMNHKGVCRTAPATLGLLIIYLVIQTLHKPSCLTKTGCSCFFCPFKAIFMFSNVQSIFLKIQKQKTKAIHNETKKL